MDDVGEFGDAERFHQRLGQRGSLRRWLDGCVRGCRGAESDRDHAVGTGVSDFRGAMLEDFYRERQLERMLLGKAAELPN